MQPAGQRNMVLEPGYLVRTQFGHACTALLPSAVAPTTSLVFDGILAA
ncbi:MAG: hypothetical protein AVDCRST_MAG02-3685 [uncultured Rubrobacteraceae bacterium]|uniref:Uncharacterized protein n=1 Tax=uncultured Rubrobacteraceae bacterium TaxID=349277 RepID=A0A6J4RD33_9ACTN|nr:MAG: hypothetical protein AVDCRST_MAG02-3685 [uncultured Rubrobacteraceae bacterium]